MSRRLRHPVNGTSEAPVAQTMRVRTRLRYSMADMTVLVALARHFDELQGKDLAERCRAGMDHDKHVWAARKHTLSAQSSARWAGFITKSSNDAYATARRNQHRHAADLHKAIATIESKLCLALHTTAERKALIAAEARCARAEGRTSRRLRFGYRSVNKHAMKRQRLEHLRSERDRLAAELKTGKVHITRGGKNLLRNRLHLEEASIEEGQWKERWAAARWSFGANGETGKKWGNETIRVSPGGVFEVDLPPALETLANVRERSVTRYRFDAKVAFSYREAQWLVQVEASRAVAYDVVFAASGRVYLDASFTPDARPVLRSFAELKADPSLRVLALDLNHGFLAPAVLDRAGNPVARLAHIALVTEGLSASVRDGHLRTAISATLAFARAHGCRVIAVENLGFDEMRSIGRERYGSRKWFRKTVCGIPTRQFRDRLCAMAARRGVAVLSVPAAYSSIFGAAHWQKPLSSKKHKVSQHTAAAVVLGRRALGHSARRKPQASPGVTAGDRRIEAAGQPAPVESYHVAQARRPSGRHHATRSSQRREGDPHGDVRPEAATAIDRGARLAKTVRAGPK
ncbi:MAG: hypothetical protein ABSC00_09835 [Acidimicrobiales bacterium]